MKTLDDYPQCSSLTIGILQIVSGIASFGLGIAAITTHATMTGWTGVGIWCGALFFTHGVLACISVGRKTVCKTIAQNVLAYIAGAFALVQLGIAGSGVYNDVYHLYRRVYYNYYPPYTEPLPSRSQVDILMNRSVISGMLLMFAIISGFCCFWGTIFGCRGLCRCCATPSLEKQIHMPAFTSKSFGTAQVTIGILSIGFGTASIAVQSSMGVIGTGVWCGIMYVIAGTFGYLAGVKKIKSLTRAAMVLSIICAPFALTQLGLSAGGLGFYYYNSCYYYDYNYDNYSKQRCYNLFLMHKDSKLAMDAIVMILAIAEGICLIVTSTVACKCKQCCACCNESNSHVGSLSNIAVPTPQNQYVMNQQLPVVTQSSEMTQLPPSYNAATQPPAPGMAPAAVFMYQNGALVPVVFQPGTITATSQLPPATCYPQMLGVVNPAVNPQHPDTVEPRTSGEEKDGPPRTPPPSYRSSSDLAAAVHNPIYEQN